jgi:uncharacterized protein (DUF433 family)
VATTKTKGDPGDRTPRRFPHVEVRVVDGEPEPYIPSTGLAVWEVAWLARAYDGDAEAIARHTLVDRELIEEGLRYAAEHTDEIDAQIALHTERSLEELLELLPSMRVLTVDASESDGRHTGPAYNDR